MDQIPINVVVFGSIPEAALIISLGLILIGMRPPFRKIVLVAIIQGLAAYYIRRNVEFGMHTLLQYISMCIFVWLIIRIPLHLSFLGVLIGIVISSLIEGTMVLIIPKLIGLTLVEIMSRSWMRVGLFLPQLSILSTLTYLCWKYNFTLENEIGLLKNR
jgi:hypothetical protein